MGAAGGIFAALLFFIAGVKKTTSRESSPEQERNFFSGVKLKTRDSRGKEISLKSDKVVRDRKDGYLLQNVDSTFELPNGEVLTVRADSAHASAGSREECEFSGNVRLSTKSGLVTETEKLFVDLKREIALGDADVVIRSDGIRMTSRRYFFDIKKQLLTLTENAQGSFKFGKVNAEKLVVRLSGGERRVVENAEAVGNVVCISENYELKAKKILYFADRTEAQGEVILFYRTKENSYNIRSDSMNAELKSGTLDNVRADGSLIIRTKNATIRADRGIRRGDLMRVFGNVAVSGAYGDVFGDEATLDMKNGSISMKKSGGIVDDGIRR
jgi:LPS export ABC transporter protein LptC